MNPLSRTKELFRSALVRGLALAAVAAGAALAASPRAGPQALLRGDGCSGAAGSPLTVVFYEVAGFGPQGALHGVVGFDVTNSVLSVLHSPVQNPGTTYSAGGAYREIDLFAISFWSFQGTDDLGDGARGSGIRLLFGLLVFGGSQDSNGGRYVFAGSFSSILEGAAHAASSPAAAGCAAPLRGRARHSAPHSASR